MLLFSRFYVLGYKYKGHDFLRAGVLAPVAPPWAKPDRFRGKLFRMITDASSKFDDYSISPKIKQILLHWDYELTEKYFSLIRQINV